MIALSLRNLLAACTALAAAAMPAFVPASPPNPGAAAYWKVDDLRTGMTGFGKTVMKGTKIETFDVEVLGVMKNVNPGRDLILCRLAGLDLEKTGVIQGMSGSPVYIEDKLVGAVSYTWPFGKEPIAGVTPFCQMHSFVEEHEKRDLAEKTQRMGLGAPLTISGKVYDAVTVASVSDESPMPADDSLWLTPLQPPFAASGFTPHSLAMMRDQFKGMGLTAMQGGAVSTKLASDNRDTKIEPGSALVVSLVMGDFDLSGLGTVTHVEGKRVYGWGHPLFSSGHCDLPLMTGFVHAVYPRQSVSFKIGSPLRPVGIINADVSTCIAGWLDKQPELVPVNMTVSLEPGSHTKTFHVQIARQPKMLSSMVMNCLTNSVDLEGDLPEEMTAEMSFKIDLEGQPPIRLTDTFSGASYSGGRAPQALYSQIANVVQMLTFNNFRQVPIKSIDCTTKITNGRRTADIEAIELERDTLNPGETLRATAFLRPFKGTQQRVPLELKLPPDFPEGSYTATICDDMANARQEIRDNPTLSNPTNIDQLMKSIAMQASIKRTFLAIRVATGASGVALNGKALPNLPPGMVEIMGSGKRTGAQPMASALSARQSTPWVVQGTESVRFTVSRQKITH